MFRTCLLLFVSIFALAGAKVDEENGISKSKFPSKIRELKSLHELIKLVNDHDMNLSIILSEDGEDEKGKTIKAVTFSFPESSVVITKSNLKFALLDPLFEAASIEEVPFEFTNAEVNSENSRGNYYRKRKGIPKSASHRFLTSIYGKNDFPSNQPNYAAQYNFKVADGKTTRVLSGDLDIALVNYSNFKEEEVNILKKALAEAYFTYADELVPVAVSKKLDQILPSYNWEVVNHRNEIGYLESGNWAQFKVLDENYLIYTI